MNSLSNSFAKFYDLLKGFGIKVYWVDTTFMNENDIFYEIAKKGRRDEMILSNKQARSLEAKIAAYSKMLGKSEEEIADFLGCSYITVKRRIDSLEVNEPGLYMVIKDRR